MAVALGFLAGCNAGTGAGASSANSSAVSTSVKESVRVATDRSGARVGVVTLPDGQRLKRSSLSSGYSHVLVGKMGPDGRPSISCVDNAPAAESFLAGGGPGNVQ